MTVGNVLDAHVRNDLGIVERLEVFLIKRGADPSSFFRRRRRLALLMAILWPTGTLVCAFPMVSRKLAQLRR